MDPLAHTLTGAALAATGLRRVTPLAATTLVIAANAPDIDALTYFAADFQSLAFRRGVTHGVLALVILPFIVTALILAFDRGLRRRLSPGAPPARAGPVLGLAALAGLTHPALDWLNSYGMRWLMPFSGEWFYGDALFIIDPWVWLGLGGVLFLMHSRAPVQLAGWAALGLLLSLLVLLGSSLVPWPARVLWAAGIAVLVIARAAGFTAPAHERGLERAAVGVLLAIAGYAAVNVAANFPARAEVREALAARGIGRVERVMVGPVAANPFRGDVVAVTPDAYHVGRWDWLAEPRFAPTGPPLPRPAGDAIYTAAAATDRARRFLTWSRFPYVEIERDTTGDFTVHFLDARYSGRNGGLRGPAVRLDSALRPVEPD